MVHLSHYLHVTPVDIHRAKVEHKTGRPYTKIYEYTYGYSMNYYQPMIDYLDERDDGKQQQQLPHLPWTNERYIQEYYPRNKIESYDEKKVTKMAVKYQIAALRNINDYAVKKRIYGSMIADRLTKLKRTLPKSYVLDDMKTRDIGKLRNEIDEIEKKTYFKFKEERRRLQEEANEDFPKHLKYALKGKSAKHISNILLTSSLSEK
jgi:hypothetical protein